MAFTVAQQWALVIVPKITGLISLFFSGLVIVTVLISKEKRNKTYHRLLLGISCVDVSSSFWLGLSTWPIPEETGIKWASGTTTTCTVQGFFTQFGIASSFYNASLSVFYVLVVRYGWREDRVLKVEPFLHAVPILWGLSTAIAGVPLTIFNSANLWCWIAPYQDRGANADTYRWVFFYGPLWTMILIVTWNVILIFHHVRKIEMKSERYTSSYRQSSKIERHFRDDADLQLRYSSDDDLDVAQEDIDKIMQEIDSRGELDDNRDNREGSNHLTTGEKSNTSTRSGLAGALSFRRNNQREGKKSGQKRHSRSREVAYQSLRYAGCFYFTWIALTLTRLLQAINGKTYYPLLVIAAATTPLQGLPNFVVYLAPRFQKAKKEKPEAGAWAWIKTSIVPGNVTASAAS